MASRGDLCAKETREKQRIMVAGGDGTIGWVLGCLSVLHKEEREPVPSVGIIPLGTDNDLARSFGWGGTFPFAWKSAVKKTLYRASMGPVSRLDSWQVVISMPSGEIVDNPHSLRSIEEKISRICMLFGEFSEAFGKLYGQSKQDGLEGSYIIILFSQLCQ